MLDCTIILLWVDYHNQLQIWAKTARNRMQFIISRQLKSGLILTTFTSHGLTHALLPCIAKIIYKYHLQLVSQANTNFWVSIHVPYLVNVAASIQMNIPGTQDTTVLCTSIIIDIHCFLFFMYLGLFKTYPEL